MKVEGKSKTDPADWPYEGILTLFERVEALLPKMDTMRYTRRLEKINWDKVKFGDFTSAECSSVFNTMIKRVRQRPNVSDLITNMKAMHERQPKMLVGTCGPKKPLTAYFLFVQEKQGKLKRKNPSLTPPDLSKLLSEKYKKLSPVKKQKYFDMYQANMDAYKSELAKFNEENPEMADHTNNSDVKGPKCLTPSALFIKERVAKLVEEDPELTMKQAHEKAMSKWKKLKDKKKMKWIKKAVEAFETYETEAANYQTTHPSFVPKTSCLTRNEQTLKEISEGMPKKPPQNGLQLYKKARYAEVHREGDTFIQTNQRLYKEWIQLSEPEREEYKAQVKQAKEEYSAAYQAYLDAHPHKAKPGDRLQTPRKGGVNGNAHEDTSSSPSGKHRVGEGVRSALSYYIEEQSKDLLGSDSDASESDVTVALTKKFKQLADHEKQKYRDMATKHREQALKTPYSGVSQKKKSQPASENPGSSKGVPGPPKKPPKSGYSLYSIKMLSELKDVPNKQRMVIIGHNWKQLADTEREAYNRKAKKKMQKYTEELEAFKQMMANGRGGEQSKSGPVASSSQKAASCSKSLPSKSSMPKISLQLRPDDVSALCSAPAPGEDSDEMCDLRVDLASSDSSDSDDSLDVEPCDVKIEIDNADMDSEDGEQVFGDEVDVHRSMCLKELRICLTPVDLCVNNNTETEIHANNPEHTSPNHSDDSFSQVYSCRDVKLEYDGVQSSGVSQSQGPSDGEPITSSGTTVRSEGSSSNSQSTVSSQDVFDIKPRAGSLELFSNSDSVEDDSPAKPSALCASEVSVHMPSLPPPPPSIIDQCLSVYRDLELKDMDLVASHILSSLSISPEQARAVEAATRQQSACDAWYHHRRGRLTASIFAQVSLTSVHQGTLVKKILSDTRYPTSSWGLDHECVALTEYRTLLSPHHKNLQLSQCGLFINPDFPHLGATPDSHVSCECCGQGLVEVKCPNSLPAFKPVQSSRCSFSFLQQHDKSRPLCSPSLPRDHSYYYQIQGQLAVCGVQYCDLVCWTPSNIHVERVVRDQHFFTQLKHKLDTFYKSQIIPAILSGEYMDKF